MGNPLTPPLILLTKKLSLSAVVVIATERKQLQTITISYSHQLHKDWIFSHFAPFVPAQGQPLDPTFAVTDKNIITEFCCNDIYGKKGFQSHYTYFLPLSQYLIPS